MVYLFYNKDHNPFFTANYNPIPKEKVFLKKKAIIIDIEINDLNDLISLCEKYPISYDVEYNINMQAIHDIKSPVMELNNMIGMKNIKTSIINQIIY